MVSTQTYSTPIAMASDLLAMASNLARSSFLLLVVRPGAPSSVLAPSSKARSP